MQDFLNPEPSTDWIAVGKIVAAQGLKGEVRVYPNSDFPERFEQPGQRWLLPPGATNPRPMQLIQGKCIPGKGLYILQFAEITNRNQAEELRNFQILVPVSDRPTLEPGEFHILDLIGLAVFDQTTQRMLGKIVALIPAGNDLLEVELINAQEAMKPLKVLIPFVEAIVPVVDLEQGRIEILPPPGLLELKH
jgi:16S rRNA processing protein RimM